jgi:hypothetical protein
MSKCAATVLRGWPGLSRVRPKKGAFTVKASCPDSGASTAAFTGRLQNGEPGKRLGRVQSIAYI